MYKEGASSTDGLDVAGRPAFFSYNCCVGKSRERQECSGRRRVRLAKGAKLVGAGNDNELGGELQTQGRGKV